MTKKTQVITETPTKNKIVQLKMYSYKFLCQIKIM